MEVLASVCKVLGYAAIAVGYTLLLFTGQH